MVNVISGAGLGLFNTRQTGLGGSGTLGQGSEGIAVNAATGNLVLSRQDQVLIGRGNDSNLLSTYNSLGQVDGDNNDGFRYNFAEQVSSLTGTVNMAGSTITRVNGDGNASVFTYSAALGLYVSGAGSGANDTLSYNSGSQTWTYIEGSSQLTETYGAAFASGQWQLNSQLNAQGLGITSITYVANSDRVNTVTDTSGQTLTLTYSGNNVSSVTTVSNGVTMSMVSYGYDAYNRLTTVTLDLTPLDNSTVDGNVYTTTYTYVNNTSNLVASVTQSDGTVAAFTYEGGASATNASRVTSVTVGSGADAQVTSYVYGTNTTDIKQQLANGVFATTTVNYDSQQRLTSVLTPPDVNGQCLTTTYTYDVNNSNVALQNDLLSVTDARGNVTQYSYDNIGNRLVERLPSGETTRWIYSSNNLLLNQIKYTGLDTTGSADVNTNNQIVSTASTGLVTRYVYDTSNRLRYVVDPNGDVTETRYSDNGQVTSNYTQKISQIAYQANTFPINGLATTDTLTETQLSSWVATIADKSTTMLKETMLDFRGQITQVTTYGNTNASGSGDITTASNTYYLYDQFGNLLRSVDPRGADINDTTYDAVYTYDGLGRVTSVTDANNVVVTTTYYDAAHKIVTFKNRGTVGTSDDLYTTSIYSSAGLVTSTQDSATNGGAALSAVSNKYDQLGLLRATIDPVGGTTYYIYDELSRRVGMVDSTGALTEYVYDADNHVSKTIKYANLVGAGTMGMLASQVTNNNYSETSTSDPLRAVNVGTTTATITTAGNTDISFTALPGLTLAAGQALRLVSGSVYMQGTIESYDSVSGAMVLTVTNNNGGSGTFSSWQMIAGGIRPTMDTANDRITQNIYNASGQLQFTIDALGSVTGMTYDGAGQLISKTQYATAPSSIMSSLYGGSYALNLQANTSPVTFTMNNASVMPSDNYSTEFTRVDGLLYYGVALAGVPVASSAVTNTSYTITGPDNYSYTGTSTRNQQYPSLVLGNSLTTNPCANTGLNLTAGSTYSVSYQDYYTDSNNNIVNVGNAVQGLQFTSTSYQPTTVTWPRSSVPSGAGSYSIDAVLHSPAVGDVPLSASYNLTSSDPSISMGAYGAFDYRITYYTDALDANSNPQGTILGTVFGSATTPFSQSGVTATGTQIATTGGSSNTVLTGYKLPDVTSNIGTINAKVYNAATGALVSDTVTDPAAYELVKGAGSFASNNNPINLSSGALPTGQYRVVITVRDANFQVLSEDMVMISQTNNGASIDATVGGGSSVTSMTIGNTIQTVTTQAGLAYVPGSRIRLAIDANNYMEGEVTSYSGTAMTVSVDTSVGSGTSASWTLSSADNRVTHYYYDNAGHMTGMLDAENYYTQYKYNAAGQLMETIHQGAVSSSGAAAANTNIAVTSYSAMTAASVLSGNQVTFTVPVGLPINTGTAVCLSTNNGQDYISGTVASYSGNQITITASANGIGTTSTSNWQLSIDKAQSIGSLTIGASLLNTTQLFSVSSGLGYSQGQRVRLSVNGGSAYIEGTINSGYSTGNTSMPVTIDTVVGSGSYSNWQISSVMLSTTVSASSIGAIAPAKGLQYFTIPAGMSYNINDRVRFSANGGATYMEGLVTQFTSSTGAMTVNVDTIMGSQSYSVWSLGSPSWTSSAPGVAVASSTVMAPATGTQAFLVPSNMGYTNGQRLRLSANGGLVYMDGVVSNYSGNVLQVSVDTAVGTGTYSSWSVGTVTLQAATSTTSLTIAVGNKSLTTQTGLALTAGMLVRIADSTGANWMEGDVVSYNSATGALAIYSATIGGSGTIASWNITTAYVRSTSTSTTVNSSLIGQTVTLSVPAGLPYTTNSRVIFAANGGSAYMEGKVAAYSTANGDTKMTITVDAISGSGTYSSWTIRPEVAASAELSSGITLNSLVSGTNYTFKTQSGLPYTTGSVVRLSSTTLWATFTVSSYGTDGSIVLTYGGTKSGSSTSSITSWTLSADPTAVTITGSYAISSSLVNTTKTFTCSTSQSALYPVNSRIRLANTANVNNYVEGTITGYSGTNNTIMSVLISNTTGNGTPSGWILSPVTKASAVSASSQAIPAVSSLPLTSVVVTTSAGMGYTTSTRIRLTANGGTAWMEGKVTNYSGNQLTFTVDKVNGSGSFTNWDISTEKLVSVAQAPATGTQTFTVAAGLPYSGGSRVRFVASGGTDYMEGTVTSYSGTTMLVNVTNKVQTNANTYGGWQLYGDVESATTYTASNTSPIDLTALTVSIASPVNNVFTIPSGTGTNYTVGARVRLLNVNNTTMYVEGLVTATTANTIAVDIDVKSGSGIVYGWQLLTDTAPTQIYTSSPSTAIDLSSLTVSIASPVNKTFMVPDGSGSNYAIGTRVRFTKTGDSSTYVEGLVTAYDSTARTLSINIDAKSGTGTNADWQLAGEVVPTSTTSLVFDTTTKFITTQANLSYTVGSYVRLATTTNNGSVYVYIEGQVQSYNSSTGNMTINNISALSGGTLGSSYANWQLLSDGNATDSTSTNVSAITAVKGLQVFTIPSGSGASYVVGNRVRFMATGNSALFMEGVLTAQTSTSMTVNVDTIGGSGTSSDWQLSVTPATTVTTIDLSTLTTFPVTETFTVPSGMSGLYAVGSAVHFTANNGAVAIDGTVSSYNGVSMTVSIASKTPSNATGAYSNWQLGQPLATSAADIHVYTIYDQRGYLVASIDGEGFLTETTYNVTGTVSSVKQYANALDMTTLLATVGGDSTQITLALIKNTSGVLTTNSEDRSTSYTYNNLNQRLTETDPLGKVTTYSYNADGQLTGASAVGGTVTRQIGNVYDLQGRLIEEDSARYFDNNDTAGYNTDKITYTYDAAGRRLTTTDAAGNITRYYYDADNRLAYTINALGEVTGMSYDAFGELTQTTQFVNRMSSAALTGLIGGSASTITSLISAIQAPNDDIITQATYNQRGSIATQSDANVMYARTKIGLLTEQYANRSQVYPSPVIQYNAFGEVSALIKAIRNINGVSYQYDTAYYSYDRRGLRTKEIVSGSNDRADVNNLTSKIQYDAFGRVTMTTDPEGNTVQLGYDRRGLVTTKTSGEGNATITTYDAFNRVLTMKEPGNTTATTYSYQQSTRSFTVTTPEGIQTQTILDQFGEVSQVKLLSSNPVITLKTYNYDKNGNVISVVDGNGNTSSTTYDARDLVATTTDRNNIITAYYYDAAKRMTQRVVDSAPGGVCQTTQWTYDAAGRQITQDYVEVSMIFGDSSRITQTSYDHNGNVTRIVKDPSTAGYTGLNLVTTYTYNRDNSVVTINEGFNNGTDDVFERITQNNYDSFGRLSSSVVDPGGSGLNLTTTYSYNKDGKISLVTSPAGIQTFSFYNKDNNLRFVATSVGDGSQLAVTENQYDAQGRLVSVIQYANAVSTSMVSGLLTSGNSASAQTIAFNNFIVPDAVNDRQSYILYNQDDQVTYSIDSSGLITHNVYNAQGLVTSRTQYATTLPTLVTGGFNLSTISNSTLATALGTGTASDRTTQTQYDNDGNVIASIDAQNYRTDYVRDAEGHILEETQESTITTGYTPSLNDHVTYYRYNSLGHLTYTLTQIGENQFQVTETDINEFGQTAGVRQLVNTLNYAVTNSTSTATIKSVITTDDTHDLWVGYGYDRAGQLTFELHVNAQAGVLGSLVTAYAYNSLGQKTHISFSNPMMGFSNPTPSDTDRITNSFYDGAGRLAYSLTMVGNVASSPSTVAAYVTQNVYNADGKVVRTIKYATPLANALSYTSTSAVATAVAAIASSSIDEINDTVYDSSSHIAYQIDGEGYVTGFTYNMFGQVINQSRYSLAIVHTTNAPTTSSVASQLTAAGSVPLEVTHYVYDQGGRVLQETAGYGSTSASTTGFGYDAFGEAITLTDPRNNLTTQQFDNNGRKLSATDALNNTTSTSYDAFGNIVVATDPRGNKGYFFYDANNQTRYQVDPNGYVTEYVRDNLGQVLQTNRYNNAISTTNLTLASLQSQLSVNPKTSTNAVYNQLGQKISVTDALINTEQTTYDAFGNVASVTDKEGYVTTYQYDQLNRKISETKDIDQNTPTRTQVTTQYSYDTFGNITQMTEAAGAAEQRITIYTYDRNNHLVDTALPSVLTQVATTGSAASLTAQNEPSTYLLTIANLGAAASIHIDTWPVNTPAVVTTADNAVSSGVGYFGIDKSLTPSTGSTSYEFSAYTVDAQGNKLQKISGAYSIDSNNVMTITRADNVINYSTQSVTPHITSGYDAAGNLVKQTDANGNITHYYYNTINQKTAVVDAEGYLHEYTYDAAGNMLNETTYNAKVASSVNLDTTKPTNAMLDVSYNPSSTRVTTYTYDADNHVINKQVGNGDVWVYQRNPANASSPIANGTQSLVTQQEYDAMGNVTKITQPDLATLYAFYDANNNLVLSVDAEGYALRHEYDANNREIRKTAYKTQLSTVALTNLANSTAANRASLYSGLLSELTTPATATASLNVSAALVGTSPTLTVAAGLGYAIGSRIRITGVGGTDYIEGNITGYVGTNLTISVDATSGGPQTYNSWNLASTENRITEYQYDGLGQIRFERIKNVLVSSFDVYGNRTTSLQDQVTEYQYDAVGNRTAVIDPAGAESDTQYDGLRRKVVEQGAAYASVDSSGNSIQVRQTTAYVYDKLGNMLSERKLAGSTNNGNIWAATQPVLSANNITGNYPAAIALLNNQLSLVNVQGASGTEEYQSYTSTLGSALVNNYQVSFDITPTQNSSSDLDMYGFIQNGQAVGSANYRRYGINFSNTKIYLDTYENGTEISTELNSNIDVVINKTYTVTLTLVDGVASIKLVDKSNGAVLGQASQEFANWNDVQYAFQAAVKNGYSSGGKATIANVSVSQQSQDHITSYQYDQAGNAISSTDPNGIVTRNYFDLNGNLISSIKQQPNAIAGLTGSKVATYEYDHLNRIVKTWAPEATSQNQVGSMTVTYDAFGGITKRGIITSMSAGSAVNTNEEFFVYDNVGRLLATNQKDGVQRGYLYDANGNNTAEITLTDGTTLLDKSASAIANYKPLLSGNAVMRKEYVYDKNNHQLATFDVAQDVANVGSVSSGSNTWVNALGEISSNAGVLSSMSGAIMLGMNDAQSGNTTLQFNIGFPDTSAFGDGSLIVTENGNLPPTYSTGVLPTNTTNFTTSNSWYMADTDSQSVYWNVPYSSPNWNTPLQPSHWLQIGSSYGSGNASTNAGRLVKITADGQMVEIANFSNAIYSTTSNPVSSDFNDFVTTESNPNTRSTLAQTYQVNLPTKLYINNLASNVSITQLKVWQGSNQQLDTNFSSLTGTTTLSVGQVTDVNGVAVTGMFQADLSTLSTGDYNFRYVTSAGDEVNGTLTIKLVNGQKVVTISSQMTKSNTAAADALQVKAQVTYNAFGEVISQVDGRGYAVAYSDTPDMLDERLRIDQVQSGTSTSSLNIATGTQTLTTQNGLAYSVDQRIFLSLNDGTGTGYISGLVTATTSGTVTIAIDVLKASTNETSCQKWNLSYYNGAYSTWNASLGIQQGKTVSQLTSSQQSDLLTRNSTRLVYDNRGALIQKLDPVENIVGENAAGLITNVNGVYAAPVTDYYYDLVGRQLAQQDAVSHYKYSDGNYTTVDTGEYYSSINVYNAVGEIVKTINPVDALQVTTQPLGGGSYTTVTLSSALLSTSQIFSLPSSPNPIYRVGTRVRLTLGTGTGYLEGVVSATGATGTNTITVLVDKVIGSGSGTTNWNLTVPSEKNYGYDMFGNRIWQANEVGDQTSYMYDAKNQMVRSDLPFDSTYEDETHTYSLASRYQSYRYDGDGNRITETTEDDFIHTTIQHEIQNQNFSYDAQGRLTNFIDGDSAVSETTYAYDPGNGGMIKTSTNADGRTTIDYYDYFNRLVKHQDMSGRITTYTYNSAGQLIHQSMNLGEMTAGPTSSDPNSHFDLLNIQDIDYTYYNTGLIRTIEDNATGALSFYAYDANGNRITERYGHMVANSQTIQATSSSINIGTVALGTSATFTLSSNVGLSYTNGTRVALILSTGTGYVDGIVTGQTASSVTITIDSKYGSGTGTSWNLALNTQAMQVSTATDLTVSSALVGQTTTFTLPSTIGSNYLLNSRLRFALTDGSGYVEGKVISNSASSVTVVIDTVAVDPTLGAGHGTTWLLSQPNFTTQQWSTGTYDALGRMVEVQDKLIGDYDIRYFYDANGNRVHMQANYYQPSIYGQVRKGKINPVTGLPYTDSSQNAQAPVVEPDDWYKFDKMNRFTVTQGSLVNGVVDIHQGGGSANSGDFSHGYRIGYDAASRRISAEYYQRDASDLNEYLWQERYNYLAGGLLDHSYSIGYKNLGKVYDNERESYDARGNVLHYTESKITRSGVWVNIDDALTFINAGGGSHSLTRQETNTFDGAGRETKTVGSGATTTMTYTAAGDLKKQSTNNGTTVVTTNYFYDYWDSAKQFKIKVAGVALYDTDGNWAPGRSDFVYDANGHLVSVKDDKYHQAGKSGRRLTYIVDAQGKVLERHEATGNEVNERGHLITRTQNYYYFNDQGIGDVGTDNSVTNQNYGAELTTKSKPYAIKPVVSADFDYNFQPINSNYPPSTPNAYTVVDGDTLRTVAQTVWGDASLWYLIADANGLMDADAALTAGDVLAIPNVVSNIHNNSSTFTPYDGTSILGNTSPTLPDAPQPAGGGGCSGVLMVVMVIIIIIVSIYTAGAAAGALGAVAGAGTGVAGATAATASIGAALSAVASAGLGTAIVAGAVGAAMGSIVGQLFGMATGLQQGFSWSQVGQAAIGGAISGGVASELSASSTIGTAIKGYFGTAAPVVNAVVSNFVIQGISVALHQQQSISWAGVAASGVGAGVTSGLDSVNGIDPNTGLIDANKNINWSNVAIKSVDNFAGSMVSQAVQIKLTGDGQISWGSTAQTAANSISSAVEAGYNERDAALHNQLRGSIFGKQTTLQDVDGTPTLVTINPDGTKTYQSPLLPPEDTASQPSGQPDAQPATPAAQQPVQTAGQQLAPTGTPTAQPVIISAQPVAPNSDGINSNKLDPVYLNGKITKDNAPGVTQADIDLATAHLQAGDRAGAYIALYNATGENLLMQQAQITTGSQGFGSDAVLANFAAKNENPDNYNITLDHFSNEIDAATIGFFQDQVSQHGDGVYSAKDTGAYNSRLTLDLLLNDQSVWASHGMSDYFPGNAVIGTYSGYHDQLTTPGAINALKSELLLETGGADGYATGKRLAEYSDNSNYKTINTGAYTQVINNSSGNTEMIWENNPVSRFDPNLFVPNLPVSADSPTSAMRTNLWNFMHFNKDSGQ